MQALWDIMVQREQAVVSHRISHHARVSGVCGFGCARVLSWGQPLSSALDRGDWRFGSAMLFLPSMLLPRLLLGRRRELSCFLGGGGRSAASWAEEGARLLLGRRRELGPSVRPAAQIHGGHVHDSTPARRYHQGNKYSILIHPRLTVISILLGVVFERRMTRR